MNDCPECRYGIWLAIIVAVFLVALGIVLIDTLLPANEFLATDKFVPVP